MFIDRWIDKEDVIHTYGRILSTLKKKEIPPFGTTWMALEDIALGEINQSENVSGALFHLYEVFKIDL